MKADIYNIYDYTNHIMCETAEFQQSVSDMSAAVADFTSLLDNQAGATVVSIKNYITGYANALQVIADAVYTAFTEILTVYQGVFAKLDEDNYAVIDEENIGEVVNAFRNSSNWLDDKITEAVILSAHASMRMSHTDLRSAYLMRWIW